MTTEADWVRVAALADLDKSGRLVVESHGISILLLKTAGAVAALRNACTHLGHSLSEGRVMAGQIICPFHGACFDIATGEARSGPAVTPLQRFAVKIDGGAVFVGFGSGASTTERPLCA